MNPSQPNSSNAPCPLCGSSQAGNDLLQRVQALEAAQEAYNKKQQEAFSLESELADGRNALYAIREMHKEGVSDEFCTADDAIAKMDAERAKRRAALSQAEREGGK